MLLLNKAAPRGSRHARIPYSDQPALTIFEAFNVADLLASTKGD